MVTLVYLLWFVALVLLGYLGLDTLADKIIRFKYRKEIKKFGIKVY